MAAGIPKIGNGGAVVTVVGFDVVGALVVVTATDVVSGSVSDSVMLTVGIVTGVVV